MSPADRAFQRTRQHQSGLEEQTDVLQSGVDEQADVLGALPEKPGCGEQVLSQVCNLVRNMFCADCLCNPAAQFACWAALSIAV